ncbi:ATP-binding protein [Flavobacterium sp. DGU11]|uniref:histidine kinase n=1 Tax=Flavobacterium arundinis TaxID=3139143 RepID=A0ABU9HU45_9FLAO
MEITKRKYIIQGVLHLVTLIAAVAIIGHFLNIPLFYKMTFIPMPIYSAIGFVLLSVAASLINHNVGITGLFTGTHIGNIMARRLFSKMFIAILVTGFFHILAQRREWISPELGSALIIVVFIVITLTLIWKTSTRLNAIDDKKRMARDNFSIAFEAAPNALILSDRHGTITLLNTETAKLYKYSREELTGSNIRGLIPERLQRDYNTKKEAFFDFPNVRKFYSEDNLYAVKKNGEEFPIELILTPVKTSEETLLLATIIDITQRKKQEETIKKQLIELQVKNKELEQFNYISSHDLQEPLRTLSNYIMLLKEDYADQLNEEMRMHLETMGASVSRMSRVVLSLLEFGKLGRKKKLAQVDCSILIGNVLTDLGGSIKESSATITVHCDIPDFYAYETELQQLFQNLINNAIKFRKQGVTPQITVTASRLPGYYEFAVTDNGIGIPRQHFDTIFHIFQRLNSSEDFEGHGIGLANCKKIAEMHGGSIWVESEPGTGSTFKFTILNLKN